MKCVAIVAAGFALGMIAVHNPNQQTHPQWWVPLMFFFGWYMKGLAK